MPDKQKKYDKKKEKIINRNERKQMEALEAPPPVRRRNTGVEPKRRTFTVWPQ